MVSRSSEPSTVCVLNFHAENLWNPPCQNYSLSEGEGEGNHQFRGSKTLLLKQPILFVGFAKSLLADSQLHLRGSSDDFLPSQLLTLDGISGYVNINCSLLVLGSRVYHWIITRKIRAKGTDILGPKRRQRFVGFQHKSHFEVDRMWFVELKGRGIKN